MRVVVGELAVPEPCSGERSQACDAPVDGPLRVVVGVHSLKACSYVHVPAPTRVLASAGVVFWRWNHVPPGLCCNLRCFHPLNQCGRQQGKSQRCTTALFPFNPHTYLQLRHQGTRSKIQNKPAHTNAGTQKQTYMPNTAGRYVMSFKGQQGWGPFIGVSCSSALNKP